MSDNKSNDKARSAEAHNKYCIWKEETKYGYTKAEFMRWGINDCLQDDVPLHEVSIAYYALRRWQEAATMYDLSINFDYSDLRPHIAQVRDLLGEQMDSKEDMKFYMAEILQLWLDVPELEEPSLKRARPTMQDYM